MLHCSALIDAQASRFRADVDERRSVFFVVVGQSCLGRGELLKNHVSDDQTGAIDGVDGVLPRRHRTGDDMDFHG